MSNQPPQSNVRQIPYHMSESEIQYRIIVLLKAVERLKELRQDWMPAHDACIIDDVIEAAEFLKPAQ